MMFSKLIRIGHDAELRYTPSGTPVLNFSGAFDYSKGEKKMVQWVKCSIYGRYGESIAGFVTKGKRLIVESSDVHNETWIKKDGTTGFSLNAVVNYVDFLSKLDDNPEMLAESSPEQDFSGASNPAHIPNKFGSEWDQ